MVYRARAVAMFRLSSMLATTLTAGPLQPWVDGEVLGRTEETEVTGERAKTLNQG
jgi:hypothetical protein